MNVKRVNIGEMEPYLEKELGAVVHFPLCSAKHLPECLKRKKWKIKLNSTLKGLQVPLVFIDRSYIYEAMA